MGWLLLILGIALWIGAHFFKRLAPEQRAALGEKGKGPVALGILAGLVLMVIGYRMAPFVPVWNPPLFLIHLNNLLMLLAVLLFGMSATTGRLRGRMRHPMLAGVKTWAVAHLLVNGDLASILLFGSMLGWAVASVILINKAGPWVDRPAPGGAKGDVKLVVITMVVYGVIAAIHAWLGVSPFG
jgi:uncharacterized membrane protein